MIDQAIDALAVHRLERLVTKDSLTVRPRARLIRWAYAQAGDLIAQRHRDRAHPHDVMSDNWEARAHYDGVAAPKLAQLITCPWCTGMWVAFGVVAARRFFPRAWRPLATALALSSAAGLLASHEAPPEPTEIVVDGNVAETAR